MLHCHRFSLGAFFLQTFGPTYYMYNLKSITTSLNTFDKAIHDFECVCDAPYITKDKNSCECPTGFTDLPNNPFESQYLSCEDIDECDIGNDCNVNAMCSNTDGSYDCKCIDGFLGDGYECHDEVKGYKLVRISIMGRTKF